MELLHFTNSGAIAKIGEVINQGDVIAYSGDTGMESIPHLHFHVIETNEDCFKSGVIGFCPSLPVSFKNASPNDKILNQGLIYAAM